MRQWQILPLLGLLLWGASVCVSAQEASYTTQLRLPPLPAAAKVSVPQIDAQTQLRRSLEQELKFTPTKFAVPNKVSIRSKSHGEWVTVRGGRLWRMAINAPGATDLNFGFSKFILPQGAQFKIVGHSSRFDDYVAGPFTDDDRMPSGEFWSPPVPGEKATLELFIPDGAKGQFQLELVQIASGFRDLFQRAGGPGFAKQGTCNNDVVCPVGDPWRNQIRSVAAYTIGGVDTCTGTLVMDAESSYKPYFLTAYHCGVTNGNAGSVVTIWNYESVMCGDLAGGSRMQTVSGATLRADREDVDMALLELSSTPPDSFDVYWSGWDRSDLEPIGSVGIHHPNVEEKAISFNFDTLTKTNNCIVEFDSGDTHWEVDNWEDGTTERGSSGSGLWDPSNQLLIGFLSGGQAACGNNLEDCYGRFGVAWDGGASDAERLSAWLDPNGTDVSMVEGSGGNINLGVDAPRAAVCAGQAVIYAIEVGGEQDFAEQITLSTRDLPADTMGTFGANPVMVGDEVSLQVDSTQSAVEGNYDFFVDAIASSADDFLELSLRIQVTSADMSTPLTPANGVVGTSLRPELTWSGVANAEEYQVQVATDAEFTNIVVDEVLLETSLRVPVELVRNQSYFWRVRALNACGNSDWSSVFAFLTADQFCKAPDLDVPDNMASGASDEIQIGLLQQIEDLDVSLDITHSYVGDLVVALEHVDTGTTVTLLDRPGLPGVDDQFGCGGEDIDVTLDDEATEAAEDTCDREVSPSIRDRLSPSSSLTAFDGMFFEGTWRLTVSDNLAEDVGVLNQWCLLPMLGDAQQPPEIQGAMFEIFGDPVFGKIVGQVSASDPDGNIPSQGAFAIIAGDTNNALSIDDDGLIRVVDPGSVGPMTITVQVTDDTGLSASAMFPITVDLDGVFKDSYEGL